MNTTRFLTIALLCSLFSPSAFAFSDVSTSHPYYNAIEWAQTLTIPAPSPNPQYLIEGYQDGTFRPNATINRAEFTKIVIDGNGKNLGGYAGISLTETFPDVAAGTWYATQLASAKRLGVIGGYPDGTFRPANSISFVEAAKIIVNTREADTENFAAPSTQPVAGEEWYEVYVRYLRERDAVPPSITRMDQLVTRAEMVEMMYRLRDDEVVEENPLCTQEPEVLMSGRPVYPIKPEFSQIGYFGQLFTAADCGMDRVEQLSGVTNGQYTLHPDIGIVENASAGLIYALQTIGFTCSQENVDDFSCTHWTLWNDVPVADILQLEPYAAEITSAGCINCG